MKVKLDILEKDLDNGLHVILVHKPDYKKSLFLLGAHVGGFDIKQDLDGRLLVHKSGVAHYLEHQMFYLNGESVSDMFANLQCATNAYTSYNQTAFYFQTTADLEKPIKLLLDFVENLDITEATVEKERGIIISEYDMYQQVPEQRIFKETLCSLYLNHPLNTDVLGTKKDIENMTVEDLRDFYHLNYDPKCLCLVGITGKDLNECFELIKKAQIDVSSKIDHKAKCHFDDEPDYVARPFYKTTMDIYQPYVCVAYKLPKENDIIEAIKKDEAISLWLRSLMSPLNPDYQKWIDERIIGHFRGAEADFDLDHAYIMFYAQTSKPDEFIDVVHEMIKQRSIDEDRFNALKPLEIAEHIRYMDNFDGLAYDLMSGYFNGYAYHELLDVFEKMTKADVDNYVSCLDLSCESIVEIYPKSSDR